MAESEAEPDEWSEWWDARVAAMEVVLGKSDDVVFHAVIPFQFGHQAGGAADVICFRNHVPGIVAVTCELIGEESQIQNELGNYELMICQRDDIGWGAGLIARLAYSTLETQLNPGETMDIGSATPEGSTIAALMFLEYARFEVRGRAAGLLLCLGITADELQACFDGRRGEVRPLRLGECFRSRTCIESRCWKVEPFLKEEEDKGTQLGCSSFTAGRRSLSLLA